MKNGYSGRAEVVECVLGAQFHTFFPYVHQIPKSWSWGHSMGGIVATSLLPLYQQSLPCPRHTHFLLLDSRLQNRLYDRLQSTFHQDPTPILSMCGGVANMLIPSQSCILAQTSNNTFRRTIFTSALEGAWTGVGHREMVWRHQVSLQGRTSCP